MPLDYVYHVTYRDGYLHGAMEVANLLWFVVYRECHLAPSFCVPGYAGPPNLPTVADRLEGHTKLDEWELNLALGADVEPVIDERVVVLEPALELNQERTGSLAPGVTAMLGVQAIQQAHHHGHHLLA